jgi:hypothetical protein
MLIFGLYSAIQAKNDIFTPTGRDTAQRLYHTEPVSNSSFEERFTVSASRLPLHAPT